MVTKDEHFLFKVIFDYIKLLYKSYALTIHIFKQEYYGSFVRVNKSLQAVLSTWVGVHFSILNNKRG